ncbi:MAG: 2-oxo acid dehydrogenase subunit E2 [Deltaproteobacteria bacterium]|nr:2-oxo acid dehydrogenase subunit E2 [Deltaproteobacteria bacterium]
MDVRVPRLAEGVESATVANILVSEGGRIEKDQVILELETEKAVGPIPSPASGTVTKIHVKEGDEVAVGQVLISLAEAGAVEKVPREKRDGQRRGEVSVAAPREAVSVQERPQPKEEPAGEYRYESRSGFPPPASPSVTKIARELNIDLTRVRGSERGGRITREDLRAYIQHLQRIADAPRPVSEKIEKPALKGIDFSRWGPIEKKRISSLRRTVGQRMYDSWSTIPHITQMDEADITDLLALRKKYAAAFAKKGAHLTLTPFALKAAVAALKKYPIFNSSMDEATGEIVYKDYFHLGVAVDTEAGLIVPVLRDVDKKRLWDLAVELNELVEKTRQRKVSLEELQGGTFTISNQGGIGGSHFTPIINKPEVAVLGLGRGVLKPVVKKAKVETRMMLPLCLSYDHRVIDGADAVRFMMELVQALENFPEKELKG